jgi:hypothetical protein
MSTKVSTASTWSAFEQKFISKYKVHSNGCWLWLEGGDKDGYGLIRTGTIKQRAHRLSYKLYRGDIPKGILVCHTCDTPSCVNPEHLFLGTHKDNNKDMRNKGREPNQNGERNPIAKLKDKDVLNMRTKYSTGQYTCAELAKEYDVSAALVNYIINRKVWRHI